MTDQRPLEQRREIDDLDQEQETLMAELGRSEARLETACNAYAEERGFLDWLSDLIDSLIGGGY